MNKIRRQLRLILLLGVLICGLVCPSYPARAADEPAASSRSAIVVDADNGQVLYRRNDQTTYPVASMSKLLTIAVIEHEIDQNKLKWSDKLKVSPEEAKISQDTSLSNISLKAGHSYTIRQLVKMSLVKSADGATITLSRAEGDNTAQFVQKMNRMAKQIGLSNYRFYNPVGLDNKDMGALKLKGVPDNAENEMTANDVAKLARYLILNHPDLLKISSLDKIKVDGKEYSNLNTMLPGKVDAPQNVTINGLKTGTSDQAGQCFVSSGIYKGRHIITVVMHSDNRFDESKQLYSYLASHYQLKKIRPNLTVKVTGSKQTKEELAAKKSQNVWLPVGQKVTGTVQTMNGQALKSIAAPASTKQAAGQISFSQLPCLNNQAFKLKLYLKHPLYRTGWLGLWDHLTNY